MSRIVVLGDLNLDVLATLPESFFQASEVRTSIRTVPGGSAGRFARIAAREGAEVTFIGCVGDDLVGELLIRSLKDANVQSYVKRVDSPTGTIVALEQDGKRTMLCSRGANDGIDAAWLNEALFRGAQHLHLSGYAFLSPAQQEAAHRAIDIGRSLGVTISVDPPPANLIHNVGVDRFLDELAPVDWLFPNLEEGQTLSGEKTPQRIVAALASAFSAGALTLGKDGSLAWQGAKRDRCRVERIDCPSPIGAGDAFAAGFAVSLLEHATLHEANLNGNRAASRLLRDRAEHGEGSTGPIDLSRQTP